MINYDLSILIPARQEMFLARTIEDILKNIEGNTEVIAVLDGAWTDPSIPDDPRVSLVYNNQSIGQRAATNQAARLSKAKYLMKCDAHCAFDKGFDTKMIAEMHDDWTMVPLMKNLHAFDWVCPEGHRRYQGPSGPCKECGKETVRDILWQPKPSPNSVSYCFDSTPHFQYFREFEKRPEGKGEITETMSLQGSCWMLTRKKYWELAVCDENFGSWGSQGIEVAVKTWLSGGRVMVNKKTWYAHMFRTQGGDFSFPYPIKASDQEKAKFFARDLFFNNKWPKQVHPFSWLVEKFWPVPGWKEEDLKKLKANTFGKETKTVVVYDANQTSDKETIVEKGIVFFTDNRLKIKIAYHVQRQLAKISKMMSIPIISASLKKMTFGNKNIHFPSLKTGYATALKQIIGALEHIDRNIIFICSHNVLYHPSHFDFTPPDADAFYFNQNVWRLRTTDGYAEYYDVNQLSGLCGYREKLLAYFREELNKDGSAEPAYRGINWRSEFPNIKVENDASKDQDTRQNLEAQDSEIHGWGKISNLIKKFK